MDRLKSKTGTILINNELQFEELSQFKYLGSMIPCDNMLETEIKTQLTA